MNSNLCPLDYRYGRDGMKKIWSEENRLRCEMAVEAALAEAHASLGTLTKEIANEIKRVSNPSITKIEKIKEIESETRHDVMAMVKAMIEQCNGDAGKFVHYGATSNDIVDTATALQIKASIEIIQRGVDSLIIALAKLAKQERDTIEIGRTHAQFAIPITFGFKVSGYITEMLRHRERLEQVKPRAIAGKMSGAVGTGASFGKNFFKIQKRVMLNLGLTYEPVATQVVGRDRYTEIVCLAANIATSLERYGTEIRNLQRPEIAEVAEPFDKIKQIGSSTMAQKHNPVMSENVCGLARIVRSMTSPTFESQVLWHERDLSNSSAERFIFPHVFTILDDMLEKMKTIFEKLEVKRDRMIKNIGLSNGLIMAESLMMKMADKGIGRQHAYEIVRSASIASEIEGKHLRDVISEISDIKNFMTEDEISEAMEPSNYTGKSKEIVDETIATVEKVLGVEI
ncbi:MAG: adenylosuccinate lyase [archaeon]|nr:adenylosuccinate lyase [archaeon]